VLPRRGGHVLQSWAWGELKGRFGWRVERLGLDSASAQVLYRPLPGGLGSIAYVPKGPLLDWDDGQAIRDWVAAIRPLVRRSGPSASRSSQTWRIVRPG